MTVGSAVCADGLLCVLGVRAQLPQGFVRQDVRSAAVGMRVGA